MKVLLLFLSLLLCFTSGCDLRKREDALQQKEAMLSQTEQRLLLKEKTLQLKEEELVQREQRLDSTLKTDSTQAVDSSLIGTWSVKMTCTETTCTGSAVGDTKNEQWTITYQANNLVAKAMANEQLIRVYTGPSAGKTAELTANNPGVPTPAAANITVRLQLVDERHISGKREIVRDNDCRIVYDLQLEKTVTE
jgi:hypothetical protein